MFGGVQEMASAPASMVVRMLSSVLPPDAMMGTSGNTARSSRTTSAVRTPAATLMMRAPASIFSRTMSSKSVTVAMTGMSISREMLLMTATGVGEFTTTPAAPCMSDSSASSTERVPVVFPPDTPVKTGRSDVAINALVMMG